MSQPVEVDIVSSDFGDFCEKIRKAFDTLEDPIAPRSMQITFPEDEFPLMPAHVESSQTMTSINGRAIEIASVVMNSAKRRVLFSQKGVGMDKLKQYIVYPGNIQQASSYTFRLARKA